MFRTAGYAGGAGARYRTVDVASRVEGASPHGLVAIMFEELLKALQTVKAAQRAGDAGRCSVAHSRALSILHGLETSLDFDKGGEIATSLSSIYREARRLLMKPAHSGEVESIEQARAMIADIASAWESVG